MNMENELGVSPEQKEIQPVKATEIWYRPEKKSALLAHELKSTIRFGDREYGSSDPKGGYEQGQIITLKIKNEDGSFDDHTEKVLISSISKKMFSELSAEDFESAGETKEDLEKYYGSVEDEQEFTVMEFEFLNDVESAKDLVKLGVMKPAQLPPENPQEFGNGAYTVPLIEHDYPAKTPVMWNRAYAKFGIAEQNVMLVGDASMAKEILNALRSDENYRGGGAGIGFKDESFDKVDELDPMAKSIGSINFIMKTSERKLRGYNTDGVGYAMSLEQSMAEATGSSSLEGKKILILGAGGTANPISFALAERGAELVVLNRSVAKAQALAERVNEHFGKDLVEFGGEDEISERAKDADVIVNVSQKGATGSLEKYSALASANLPATPESIQQNESEAEQVLSSLKPGVIVSDINLVKGKTPLLEQSEQKGLYTLDGIGMVVNQGVEAFWILYGETLEQKGFTKKDVMEVMTQAASES